MERKADIAYEQIKRKIITGTLKPMIDINEDALQKELNFSRTPIREALLKLQVNGYIVVFPNISLQKLFHPSLVALWGDVKYALII